MQNVHCPFYTTVESEIYHSLSLTLIPSISHSSPAAGIGIYRPRIIAKFHSQWEMGGGWFCFPIFLSFLFISGFSVWLFFCEQLHTCSDKQTSCFHHWEPLLSPTRSLSISRCASNKCDITTSWERRTFSHCWRRRETERLLNAQQREPLCSPKFIKHKLFLTNTF